MICRDTNTKSGKMIDISKTRTSRTWRAVQRSYEMLISLQSETVIGPRIRRNYACSPLRAQFVGGKNDNKLLNVFNFTLGSCPICLMLNPPLQTAYVYLGMRGNIPERQLLWCCRVGLYTRR